MTHQEPETDISNPNHLESTAYRDIYNPTPLESAV